VTATRRDTKLFDTPISLTVIGTQELTAIGADAMGDALRRRRQQAARGAQRPGELFEATTLRPR